MATSQRSDLDRRAIPRIEVTWQARCEIGDAIFVGEIRDWSPDGFYFVPEAGYASGQLLVGDDLLAEIAPDDCVVVFVDDPGRMQWSFAAEVRWVGMGREGAGFGGRCTTVSERRPTRRPRGVVG